MTQLELQAPKLNLIQDIINTVDNDELLSRLEVAYNKIKKHILAEKQRPCVYTLEEVNKRLDEAEKAVAEGRVFTTEQVREKLKLWQQK